MATVFPPVLGPKLHEELQELRIDEENEERRILYTLTAMLSDKAEIISQNNRICLLFLKYSIHW